jgi:hypothetical protein
MQFRITEVTVVSFGKEEYDELVKQFEHDGDVSVYDRENMKEADFENLVAEVVRLYAQGGSMTELVRQESLTVEREF